MLFSRPHCPVRQRRCDMKDSFETFKHYYLNDMPSIKKASRQLFGTIEYDHYCQWMLKEDPTKVVKFLSTVNSEAWTSSVLRISGQMQHIDALRDAMSFNPSPTDIGETLYSAIHAHRTQTIEFLLPHLTAGYSIKRALFKAAEKDTGLLKRILDINKQTANISVSENLYHAIIHYHNAVQIFIPYVDVTADNNKALRVALQRLNQPLVEFLLPLSDPQEALKLMNIHPTPNHEQEVELLNQCLAAATKTAILNEVNPISNTSKKKVM